MILNCVPDSLGLACWWMEKCMVRGPPFDLLISDCVIHFQNAFAWETFVRRGCGSMRVAVGHKIDRKRIVTKIHTHVSVEQFPSQVTCARTVLRDS